MEAKRLLLQQLTACRWRLYLILSRWSLIHWYWSAKKKNCSLNSWSRIGPQLAFIVLVFLFHWNAKRSNVVIFNLCATQGNLPMPYLTSVLEVYEFVFQRSPSYGVNSTSKAKQEILHGLGNAPGSNRIILCTNHVNVNNYLLLGLISGYH